MSSTAENQDNNSYFAPSVITLRSKWMQRQTEVACAFPARRFDSPDHPSNPPLHLFPSDFSFLEPYRPDTLLFLPCEVHQIVWAEPSFTNPPKLYCSCCHITFSLKTGEKKKFCPTCDSQTAEQKMPAKSNAGETMAWSQSVDTLLANKDGLAAFRTFLKSEFSEENVEFWLACEDFKKTKSSTKIASKAQKIYSDFIQADAPKEINIDFHTKTDISQNMSEPTLSCFDDAQRLIYSLMAKDSFPRFLRSEVYRELVKKQQNASRKRCLPFL